MGNPLHTDLTQMAMKIGVEGTDGTGTLAAIDAGRIVKGATFDVDQTNIEREGMRATSGAQQSVKGMRLVNIALAQDLKGSAVPGVPPSWGVPLRACGMEETIIGAASNTTPVPNAANAGTGDLVVAGVFSASENIKYRVTITDLQTDSDVLFSWIGLINGVAGEQTSTGSGTFVEGGAAQPMEADLTLDFGAEATDHEIGDEWTFWGHANAEVQYATQNLDGAACLDIGFFNDGLLRKAHSARGKFTITLDEDAVPDLGFEFQGVDAEEEDLAMLASVVFDDTTPVAFINIIITEDSGQLLWNGVASQLFTKMELTCETNPAPRKGANTETGVFSIRLASRKVTLTLNPEAGLIADFDPFTLARGSATKAIHLEVNDVDGNIVEIDLPRVEVNSVKTEDASGIMIDVLECTAIEPETGATPADFVELTITAR